MRIGFEGFEDCTNPQLIDPLDSRVQDKENQVRFPRPVSRDILKATRESSQNNSDSSDLGCLGCLGSVSSRFWMGEKRIQSRNPTHGRQHPDLRTS